MCPSSLGFLVLLRDSATVGAFASVRYGRAHRQRHRCKRAITGGIDLHEVDSMDREAVMGLVRLVDALGKSGDAGERPHPSAAILDMADVLRHEEASEASN